MKRHIANWAVTWRARLAALVIPLALAGCGGGIGHGCFLCGPFADNLGGSVSGLVGSRLTLQNNSTPLRELNGPAANGTSVLFGIVNFNTGYSVTVKSQPTNPSQTCVVANGMGTSGTSDVTNVAVTCTTNSPRFVYVTNGGSNNVSAYAVDATNGTLAPIAGSPFAAGNLPVAVAVDPTGSYVYVANQTDATVSAFTVDRMSGALTAVSGSPFPTGPAPTSVAIDPSSSFAYVTSGNAGTVWVYCINAHGALTAVTGSPFAAGTLPSSVTVAPLDDHVYVANQSDKGSNNISAYALSVSGTLTALAGAPFAVGGGPSAVAVDPTGRFIYVANASSGDVSVLAINTGTGALSAVSGAPYAAGSRPSSIAISD